MEQSNQDIRAFLITEAFRFIERAVTLPGVRRVALLGSIVAPKTDPKDVDILITIDDDADLTALATAARRLKGMAQGKNKGADIFLANTAGEYIGRLCHWSRCGPQFRSTCDAWNCGVRHYLHDDFGDIRLKSHLVKEPPLEIWPTVVYRQKVAGDLLPFLAKYEVSRGEA
jgi:predicted nucleotidyltransferase